MERLQALGKRPPCQTDTAYRFKSARSGSANHKPEVGIIRPILFVPLFYTGYIWDKNGHILQMLPQLSCSDPIKYEYHLKIQHVLYKIEEFAL